MSALLLPLVFDWLLSFPCRLPSTRIRTPTDVAEAVFFLSSPASGFITGQSLMLDGGRTLTLPSGKALKTT